MEINYFGHSCFSVKVLGKHLLFDPFIRGNELAKNIEIDQIQADYILVSHAHEDHVADLVYLAKKTGALVIGAFELGAWLKNKGVENFHPMNLGGKWIGDFGKLTMTYAAHSSSFSDGTYGGVAAGYIIESNGKTVYYSGDTALTTEMKLLGEIHRIDLALLPIGDNFTMGYEDAAMCASFLHTKQVIGLHYDTFNLIQIDHEKAIQSFKEKNISLTLLKIGDQFTL